MRLFTQLVIILSVFMSILATSILVQNFNNSMTYIQNQLYTNSVNTAHWLGLSLSITPSEELAVKQSLIDAAFDSGYYERITLLDINEEVLYTREDYQNVYEVPEWFFGLIQIENKVASSDIVINWRRFGRIEVSSRSGFAYYQMYDAFLHFINIFLITIVMGFVVLYILLRIGLRPLAKIEEQAEKIKDNIFVIEDKIPFTTEFKAVSVAINGMISKFKDIFEQESETMHRYQELLYKDPETNIYNRKYLTVKFLDYMQDSSSLGNGVYMMFSTEGMNRLKREYGYEHYLKVVKHFVGDIQKVFKGMERSLFIRLNENDFILIVPSSCTEELVRQGEEILGALRHEVNALDTGIEKYFRIGCAVGEYSHEDTLTRLLSKADTAVSIAKQEGNFQTYIDQTDKDTLVLGREELRNELLSSMYELRLILESEPVTQVIEGKERLTHEKVFLKLLDTQGQERQLPNLMSIAIDMGIADKIDYYLMKKVFELMQQPDSPREIAVSLTADFIKKSSNVNWLIDKLTSLQKEKPEQKIWLSVSNTTALQETESVRKFAMMIKSLGYVFGIDHFFLPEVKPKYLQILRPAFLRVNTLYIYDMTYGNASENTRRNLLNIVNSIGTEIIATHVDEASDIDKLLQLGITHMQGKAVRQ